MIRIRRYSATAILLLLLLVQPLYGAQSKQTKAVVLLYSEDKAHPAHELTDQGIREAFRSNELFDIILYTEYLDLSRFSGTDHLHIVSDYLRRKYAGLKIDVLIGVYPAAVEMLLGEARSAFPGVPIVACEMTGPYAESLVNSPSRAFITGVVMAENMAGLLDAAFRMRPNMNRE
jgi:hypothetical protein